ncbi:MAG: type I 3-dehydroquinate dehydratase [Candidatus Cloacimonetes bacterium]|nr:type I 3-dehydroquinate dehydratase [Candidatus Cloacimonadota bacterium]
MIILSIPFLSEKISHEFSEKFADELAYLEFRLDRQRKYYEFPKSIMNSKTIITIRDVSECGERDIPFSDKIKYYEKVVTEHDCLVDLEINNYQETSINPDNLILSFHDFSDTLQIEKFRKIIDRSNSIPSKFLKIAVKINRYSELLEIRSLISESKKPVIFAGLGKLGKFSRLIYQQLGAVGTFIGLVLFPTATGQLNIDEAKKYGMQNISQETKIGGIIGGKQVKKSLGISFYNEYFRKNKIDAVYLPFVVEDFEDFWFWIENSNIDFYGFSITMPFKREAGERKRETGKSGFFAFHRDSQKKEFSAVNLYLPKTNEFLNTDFNAFQKAFDYLQIKEKDKILIYGSGGTAETALYVLQDFFNVSVSSRNEKAGKELAAKYSVKFKSQGILCRDNFDLVINCTPVGMNNEDLLAILNIQLHAKIIDLPYSNQETPLIQKSEKDKIPFVDGKMFWKWQAEKQLKEFAAQICILKCNPNIC